MRLLQIVFHNRFHLAGRNRVQIENIGYRDPNKLFFVHNCC